MIEIVNILLFLIYPYGLGYSLTYFLKGYSLELTVMRIGLGLGALIPLALTLNALHLPIDWRIILFLSLFLPLCHFFQAGREKKSSVHHPNAQESSKILIILVILFIFNIFIYCGGAFQYPWLEDDDSWRHAASIKYVAVEKTVNVNPGELAYLHPYPPGYAIILGLMHQTHPSLYWTIKFFNGFIVALGILFFYFFVKIFNKNEMKAAFATIFLAFVPCYLTHFIWAHALVVTLFFPAFYFALKAQDDQRYIFPASVLISSLLLIQPEQSFKFTVMFILLMCWQFLIFKTSFKRFSLILCIAVLISVLLWWGGIFSEMAFGKLGFLASETHIDLTSSEKIIHFLQKIFNPGSGTATRAYTFSDFLYPPESNLITNPIGIGPVLSILALGGIFVCLMKIRKAEKNEKLFFLVILSWFVFTFLGVNSLTFHLPIGLITFRFWMLLAIPISLLAAEMIYSVRQLIRKSFLRIPILLLIMISILISSGYAKIKTNTSIWPYGVLWSSKEELMGYLWMRYHLPANTKVFAFVENKFVIGHDMMADYWSKEYKNSFHEAFELTPAELVKALKKNSFKYVVIDQRAGKRWGKDLVREKIQEIQESGLFELTLQLREAIWIFKVL